MLPMVLYTTTLGGIVYGEIEGAFWCPGFGNQSENVIQVAGIDYLVFQNGYRTGTLDYFALRME